MTKGYLVEHRYSSIQLIDETNTNKEFPDHTLSVGPLMIWREDIIPVAKHKDKKLTYYKLNKQNQLNPKKKEDLFVAVLTDYDQNLSALSFEMKRKEIDPESQQLISRVILFISFTLNVFLLIQDALHPDEPLLLNITSANAGWIISIFAFLKIIDLMQERPAIYTILYAQYWAKVMNESAGKQVDVAFCTILLTDKKRISDSLPLKIEADHVLVHYEGRKKAEDKFYSERAEKLGIERAFESLKNSTGDFEQRLNAAKKEAYTSGLRDATHSVVPGTSFSKFKEYPEITWPIALIFGSVVFYFTLRSMSLTMPDVQFVIELAKFPIIFWILLFVLGFFVLRWFFQLLGVVR